MVFGGSADLQFIGTVTGLSLVHGVTYTVSVVARNSVGASETFTGMVTASFVVQGMHNGTWQYTVCGLCSVCITAVCVCCSVCLLYK